MLIPNHPAHERLSALASADPDVTSDDALTGHVAGCPRCGQLVDDLMVLRTSLAELPDLRPSRPLRLLPEVAAEPAPAGPADRLAGLMRRVFGPMVTAGAAVAMVGLVGTAGPILNIPIAQDLGSALASDAGAEAEGDGVAGGEVELFGSQAPAMEPGGATGQDPEPGTDNGTVRGEHEEVRAGPLDTRSSGGAPAERSPWPMVLFTGVAVVIGALMLRWILVPRAG